MVNKYKLAKMEVLAFKNGLRLHRDAISLFNLRSYPSVYFLSILALEEFGKAEALSHFLFYWSESPFTEQELQDWFLELYKHPFKHHAFFRGRLPMASIKRLKNSLIKVDQLEILKQNSVYVGLPKNKRVVNLKGKINLPSRIKQSQAKEQITVVNDYLLEQAIGNINQFLSVDNWVISRMLNRKFLQKFEKNWPYKSFGIKKLIRRFPTKKAVR